MSAHPKVWLATDFERLLSTTVEPRSKGEWTECVAVPVSEWERVQRELADTPQPQGVEVGRFDAEGFPIYTERWIRTKDNKLANHRLVAVPTQEAK